MLAKKNWKVSQMEKPQISLPEKIYTTEAGKELTMTYGMFNDIMRILGSTGDAVEILLDNADLRGWVIRRLFTEDKREVKNIDELINPYDIDISPLELDGIVAWVADHVMHFTMSTTEKTRPVVQKYADRVATVSSDPSKNGSAN